jgi:hypothetical protein
LNGSKFVYLAEGDVARSLITAGIWLHDFDRIYVDGRKIGEDK